MVINSQPLQNQSSKITLPFNYTTSLFPAPVIEELERNHNVTDQEYRQLLWNASKEFTKINKRKTCCKIGACCSYTFLTLLLLIGFIVALSLMLGVPNIGRDKIYKTLTSKRTETLLVTGSTNAHHYILEKAHSLKLKMKVFDYKPSTSEMKNALYDYYYVYIQDLSQFQQEETDALCDALKGSKHSTFIGGFRMNDKQSWLTKSHLKKHCRKNTNEVHFIDPLPSSAWTWFACSTILGACLILGTTTACCCCISSKRKNNLLKLEREINRESMEKFLPRGVHFSFNADESHPAMILYFYGSNVQVVEDKPQTVPFESSNYIQTPQQPVVLTQQDTPVYYQQVDEVQPFLYPNPYGNINGNQNYSTFSSFPKK